MVFNLFGSKERKPSAVDLIKNAEEELFAIHGTGHPGQGLRVLARFGMASAICGYVTSTANGTTNIVNLRALIGRIQFDFSSSTDDEGSVVYDDILTSRSNLKSFDFSARRFLKFHSYGEPSLVFSVSFSQAWDELMSAFYADAARFVAKEPDLALPRAAILVQEFLLGPLNNYEEQAALFNTMHSRTQVLITRLTKDLLNSN